MQDLVEELQVWKQRSKGHDVSDSEGGQDEKPESEHGEEPVLVQQVDLRAALHVASDEQFRAFIESVQDPAPPPPISQTQAALIIRDTTARARSLKNVIGHTHNPLHSLTCHTNSKVLTSATWVRADNPSMREDSEHAEYGENAMYNGQVSSRYDGPAMLL